MQPPQLPHRRHFSGHHLTLQRLEDRPGGLLVQFREVSNRAHTLPFQLTTAVQNLQGHALGLVEVRGNEILLGSG